MNKSNGESFSYAFYVPADVKEEMLKKDVEAAWKAGIESEDWVKDIAKREGLQTSQPFKIEATQGADPLTAAILVTLATGGAQLTVKIANDIWDKIILPWLVRKYGSDAIRK